MIRPQFLFVYLNLIKILAFLEQDVVEKCYQTRLFVGFNLHLKFDKSS